MNHPLSQDLPPAAPAERVLHLVEGHAPESCATTLALLAQLREQAGRRSAVLLLGNPDLGRLAQTAGVEQARRVGVPYGRAVCGLLALRRELAAVGPVSQVVCWSAGALLAARLLRPATPRVLVAVQPMGQDAGRLTQWCLRRPGAGGTRVVTLGAALRTSLIAGPLRGWDEAVAALPVVALRDPRSGRPWTSEARGTLRSRWGVPDERVKVVAMLADPSLHGDAQAATMAVAVARDALCDAGWPGDAAMLLHPDQWHRPRAQRMIEQLGGHFPVVLESRLATPWQVMAGCDVALAMGPAAGGLAMTVAMAAGVPVIAEPTPRIRERLTPERTGRLATTGQPKAIAHQLTVLLRDPDTAGRLRLAARHELARDDEPVGPWLRALERCEPTAGPAPTADAPAASAAEPSAQSPPPSKGSNRVRR